MDSHWSREQDLRTLFSAGNLKDRIMFRNAVAEAKQATSKSATFFHCGKEFILFQNLDNDSWGYRAYTGRPIDVQCSKCGTELKRESVFPDDETVYTETYTCKCGGHKLIYVDTSPIFRTRKPYPCCNPECDQS